MMNTAKQGVLYGLCLYTDIKLPVDFPFPVSISEHKVTNLKTISFQDSLDTRDFFTYSQNENGSVLYKKNWRLNTVLIETDRIGSVVVNDDSILYIGKRQASTVDSQDENIAFLLSFGLGISIMLRMNKYIVLHATALRLNGKTILIMGPSGVGKSTFCSYLIKNYSAELVSDDMTCVNLLNWKLYAGFPMMKLWPESIENIFQSDTKKLKKVGKHGKRYFPISNRVKQDKYSIDTVIMLKKAMTSRPFLITLDKKQTLLDMFKNIFNRPCLDNIGLGIELCGISNMFINNQMQGYILQNPKRYECLDEMADLLNCL